MKNFKSFIQLDEVERVKYKDGIANKMAAVTYLAQTKDPGDLEKVGPEEVGPRDTKKGSGKRPADRLDNKQPFGEAESHQSKTTMKHISNPNAGEKKAAKDIKPGIKGYRDRIDMLKSAQARGALKKEGKDIAFSGSHQGKTTLKHIKNPDVTQRMAAHDIKPGIKGYRDRIALLKDAGQRKNLKKEDFDLLSDLYDHLDESNQEIFLNQLEEDAEVLLAFAKAMADE